MVPVVKIADCLNGRNCRQSYKQNEADDINKAADAAFGTDKSIFHNKVVRVFEVAMFTIESRIAIKTCSPYLY
jgi:hypothetical protein